MKKINKKLLLVEDDINLATVLKDFLELKGFSVEHSSDGEDGMERFNSSHFDLCLLDIMMPKKDGFTLAKEIHAMSEVPIIFLTAKSMQKDKIEGLKIGADDYITKPFNTEELLLRIKIVLKRTSSYSDDNLKSQFNIGKYLFDFDRRVLKLNRLERKLTSKEAELLRLLCICKNQVLKREVALNKIWKNDSYFNARSMDVYIAKLRNYLKNDESIEIINVHGEGFKLID